MEESSEEVSASSSKKPQVVQNKSLGKGRPPKKIALPMPSPDSKRLSGTKRKKTDDDSWNPSGDESGIKKLKSSLESPLASPSASAVDASFVLPQAPLELRVVKNTNPGDETVDVFDERVEFIERRVTFVGLKAAQFRIADILLAMMKENGGMFMADSMNLQDQVDLSQIEIDSKVKRSLEKELLLIAARSRAWKMTDYANNLLYTALIGFDAVYSKKKIEEEAASVSLPNDVVEAQVESQIESTVESTVDNLHENALVDEDDDDDDEESSDDSPDDESDDEDKQVAPVNPEASPSAPSHSPKTTLQSAESILRQQAQSVAFKSSALSAFSSHAFQPPIKITEDPFENEHKAVIASIEKGLDNMGFVQLADVLKALGLTKTGSLAEKRNRLSQVMAYCKQAYSGNIGDIDRSTFFGLLKQYKDAYEKKRGRRPKAEVA
jgi:hypothetical protein